MNDPSLAPDEAFLEAITAQRLNVEPAILRGCTSSELLTLVVIATVIWVPLSLLIAWLLGALAMAMGLAGIGILLTVVAMAQVFQRIKRGRPDGYAQQAITVWLHRRRWRRSRFCLPEGRMVLGRTGRKP